MNRRDFVKASAGALLVPSLPTLASSSSTQVDAIVVGEMIGSAIKWSIKNSGDTFICRELAIHQVDIVWIAVEEYVNGHKIITKTKQGPELTMLYPPESFDFYCHRQDIITGVRKHFPYLRFQEGSPDKWIMAPDRLDYKSYKEFKNSSHISIAMRS